MYYSFDTKDDYIYTMKIIDEMDQVIDKIKLTSDIYDEIIYNINHNDQYSVVSLDIPRFHMLYSYLIILYNMKKQMYIRKINAITKQEIYNYAINYDNGE